MEAEAGDFFRFLEESFWARQQHERNITVTVTEVTRLSRRSGSRAGVRATRRSSPRPGLVLRGRESDVNWPLLTLSASSGWPGSLSPSEDSDPDQVKSIAAGSPRPGSDTEEEGPDRYSSLCVQCSVSPSVITLG